MTVCLCGGMEDAADSKSVCSDTVRVQVPPPARYKPLNLQEIVDLVVFLFAFFGASFSQI